MKKEQKKQLVKTLLEELEKTVQLGINPSPSLAKTNMQKTPEMSKAKETVVKFDKNTSPYEVIFSERGFEVGDTRFSFEFIETALSKEINIVLKKGEGLILDSIKMEKILKYKDLYSRQNSSSI